MMQALHTETGAGRRAARGELSLAELKSRRTPVEWFEGIAIVQEVCGALLASGAGANGASFGPDDVIIDAAGSVRAGLHEGSGDESVARQLGELLHLVLADSSFPVPLRLLITQATSTPPFYASIAELSSALEYFERPDRPGLIRAAYERAQKLPVVPETSEAAQVEHKKPAPKKKKPGTNDTASRKPLPKGLIYGAAAAVAVIAIGAGAVAWSSGRPQRVAPVANLEKESRKASDRGKSASNPRRVNPATHPGSPRQVPLQVTAGARVSWAPKPLHDLPPLVAVELSPAEQSSAPDAVKPVTFAAYDVPADSQQTIYSARDADVTPPIATYPRLPAEPPGGVRTDFLSTLELLVSETGEVESVKLRGRPAHLADALLATMNLSAAKTWRFVPAIRDGRPVKYRKLVRVWWVSAP
jgi:hypothetical protein